MLAALVETGLEDSTHIVCTSDHGELLGAHGGLHQKWYNAFEETVRVPMVIAEAEAPANRRGVVSEQLSSHEDLVPTLLSLAEIIDDSLDENFIAGFETAPKLPGTSLAHQVRRAKSTILRRMISLRGRRLKPQLVVGSSGWALCGRCVIRTSAFIARR